MTEISKTLQYPSRKFMSQARAALSGGRSVLINIRPGWRTRLLSKTLEFWPKRINDNERLKYASKFYSEITSLFLFSLFHNHIYALISGYEMSYLIAVDGISVNYSIRAGN
jgi:hypothetical protein